MQKSTIILLRIPFSFFLMPVFFFALSQVPTIDWGKTILIFVIIHFIMYPASNGYNSYMDRDEGSIGLLEKPPRATKELFYLTAFMDIVSVIFSLLINIIFTICIVATIAASHAYSYRRIRLKKYPVTGFLTVVFFQGALTYFMVYYGAALTMPHQIPWQGMLISALLFGGFYPLTQIYQHEQDLKDGVRTISFLLGIHGTFVFSGLLYLAAEVILYFYFKEVHPEHFYLLQLFFIPIIAYFLIWWTKVRENLTKADYHHTMRMNLIAASSMNVAFILILWMNIK